MKHTHKILLMLQRLKANKFWPDHILPATIILIGFALRLYKLGSQSLWYDETVSAFLASRPTLDLIAHTARDIHPPGYYLLLHFWTMIVGNTEFALAFLSLIFGVLIIPLTYLLARYLVNKTVATWSLLLVTFSPYHVWYAQEVRMYTLGAALGLAVALCGLYALAGSATLDKLEQKLDLLKLKKPGTIHFWLGYLILATIGLYVLYYFAFLLVVFNLFFLIYTLLPKIRRPAFLALLLANGLLVVAYFPWLPIAWRQATNPPVPPWRTQNDLTAIILESWSALSLGQSVEPVTVWPILLLTLGLFSLGLYYLSRATSLHPRLRPSLFLPAYTFGPLLLIYLLSFLTPLYHVRYIFTYSPAFYLILGAGLVWLTNHTRLWSALVAISLLLLASLFSIYQLHFNPRYRTDDYRTAVNFIQSHWQPGDVILANAGYTYTAFLYYANFSHLKHQRLVPYQPPADLRQPLILQTGTVNGPPQLGWGDLYSDFYAISDSATVNALEKLSQDFSRLWMLRAYDTVTDPTALVRTWLADHTIPLEDEVFAGESNIRAQGFLLAEPGQPTNETIRFEDGMALADWFLPASQTWQPGQTIHLQFWWMTTASPSTDYKMSLKLWTPTGELAAQGQDEWPAGSLYRATTWPIGQAVYHPSQLTLPSDLSSGQYWLDLELYHSQTILPLPLLDGRTAVTLGPIMVNDNSPQN